MVPVIGNTFPVKEDLKKLGARWDPDKKAWMVPEDKVEEAKKLVEAAPTKQIGNASKPFRHTRCQVCGHKATGRYGDVIYKSGECRDCYEERKMGY